MVAGLKPGVLNQNMGSVAIPNPVCKCSKPTAKLSKVWELILLGLANVAPILRHHLHEHLVGGCSRSLYTLGPSASRVARSLWQCPRHFAGLKIERMHLQGR